MANHDMTTVANKAKMVYHPKQTTDGWHKIEIDLADLNAVKGSAAAATDTFDVQGIPAGGHVTNIILRTHVPVAGGSVSSPTVAIGDQSAASYLAATAVDSAANTTVIANGAYFQAATSPYGNTGGQFYTAANTLRITLGGTWTGATAGRFEILMKMNEFGTGLFI